MARISIKAAGRDGGGPFQPICWPGGATPSSFVVALSGRACDAVAVAFATVARVRWISSHASARNGLTIAPFRPPCLCRRHPGTSTPLAGRASRVFARATCSGRGSRTGPPVLWQADSFGKPMQHGEGGFGPERASTGSHRGQGLEYVRHGYDGVYPPTNPNASRSRSNTRFAVCRCLRGRVRSASSQTSMVGMNVSSFD